MLIQQQPAYVLHARPWRETSLLLECLSRDHGRLGVVARGVRQGGRGRLQRSQMEPFQCLALDLVLRGELATLRAVESLHGSARLQGDALLAGLYVNELVVRLSARQDPHRGLYDAYAHSVQRLAASEPVAWTLRRFERDLLQALGYGLQLQYDADSGEPLEPQLDYRYLPEHGPVAGRSGQGMAVRGVELLALGDDRMPDASGMGSLRRLLRGLLIHHLGGIELRSWRVLRGALSRRS